jgi:hypothetical protein
MNEYTSYGNNCDLFELDETNYGLDELNHGLDELNTNSSSDIKVIVPIDSLCVVCLELEGILKLCSMCELKYCDVCAVKLSNKCCVCFRNKKTQNTYYQYYDPVEFEVSYESPYLITIFLSFAVSMIMCFLRGIFTMFIFIFLFKIILNTCAQFEFLFYWIMN